MPLDDLRAHLLEGAGALVTGTPPGAETDSSRALNKATDNVAGDMRRALAANDLTAYVEHPDGRIYRIPPCYWGSFHDYRPLAGAGFCSDRSHGDFALEFDGRGVFVSLEQADAKWPQQRSMVAKPIERKRPGPARDPIASQAMRALPEKPFVSLTEAKSWLAFGTALPQNELMHHIATGSFGSEAEAERESQQALDKLLDAVVEEALQM